MRNNCVLWKRVLAVVVALLIIPITTPGAGTAPSQTEPQVLSGAKPQTADQVLSSGLWRVDRTFQSSFQIYNRHILQHRTVIPVLYMADGTEYDLPSVDLAPNSFTTISVNDAMESAPPQVIGHVSMYGSASVHFLAPTTGSVAAAMQIFDAANSLKFIYEFHPPDRMEASQHTFDGLWWRRDAGVAGFVGLANRTSKPLQVSLQVIGAAGAAVAPQTVVLAGHSTQLLSLDDLAANLPGNQALMGGLHVVFTGNSSDLIIAGGLENRTEGYSALIPFYMHDTSSSPPTPVTVASTGIMVGQPDAAMKFPAGTTFFPYTYLRNASSSPMKVERALYYTLAGGGGQRVSLPLLTINAGNAVQVALDFGSIGLGGFNGQITESFSTVSNPGDLVVATGSTDQTANYVFEVLPQVVASTASLQDLFWRVGSSYDTMTTLWNSGETAEDLLITFSFAAGKGHYKLPLHLASGASATIDMADLIGEAKPDLEGNLIPPGATAGGMIVSGPSDLMDKINVILSGGIFSVFGATCVPVCYSCGPGLESFDLSVATGTQMAAKVTTSTGAQFDETSRTKWGSQNTAIANVASGGVLTPIAAGTVTIDGLVQFTFDGERACYPGICTGYTYQSFIGVKIAVSSFGLQFQDASGCHYFPTCTGTCTLNGRFSSPSGWPGGVCPKYLFCADAVVLGVCLIGLCISNGADPHLCT